MNDKFFDLKKEKQDKMINAALKVFALQGYKHASTDEIVKEAGISKGLLFHYFASKIGTYEFVYDYSTKYMLLELSALEKGGSDIYALLLQMEEAKLQVLRNYPYMQQFLVRASKEEDAQALQAVAKRRKEYDGRCQELLASADLSRLREGIDVKKLLKIIDYMVCGIMADGLSKQYNPDLMHEEVKGYLAMLKEITYKA